MMDQIRKGVSLKSAKARPKPKGNLYYCQHHCLWQGQCMQRPHDISSRVYSFTPIGRFSPIVDPLSSVQIWREKISIPKRGRPFITTQNLPKPLKNGKKNSPVQPGNSLPEYTISSKFQNVCWRLTLFGASLISVVCIELLL